jgi:hypothetical protein
MHFGASFPFWFYEKTGCYGGGSYHSRHYWFGIKGIIGVRFSKEW